ncbi:MAG: hypothetical protein WCH77_05735 [Planctomycetota bacterium]
MEPSTTNSPSRFRLPTVAFFGRTMPEYLEMLALDTDRLRGLSILDVASGPGSFVAESLAMGLDVIGCDPLYGSDPGTIVAQGKADIDACREQIRRNPDALVYGDIEAFYRDKYAALERFAVDFASRRNEDRYVAGALPLQPFADRSFDLVVTANFLMVYAPLADGGMHDGEDFDLGFHLSAVDELARVTRGELRISGMHTWKQPPTRHPYCHPMMNRLEEIGFRTELVASRYDDGCSAVDQSCNHVLVARREGSGK